MPCYNDPVNKFSHFHIYSLGKKIYYKGYRKEKNDSLRLYLDIADAHAVELINLIKRNRLEKSIVCDSRKRRERGGQTVPLNREIE